MQQAQVLGLQGVQAAQQGAAGVEQPESAALVAAQHSCFERRGCVDTSQQSQVSRPRVLSHMTVYLPSPLPASHLLLHQGCLIVTLPDVLVEFIL
jgi:hypothetical protein